VSKKSGDDLAALVNRCLQGDKQAWAELIDRLYPIVTSICRSMKLSWDETLDIFGQIQWLLLLNLKNVKSPEKLRFYVTTMTRREIREADRRSNLLKHLHWPIIEALYSALNKTPDAILEDAQRSEKLMLAMAKLPPRCYKLLTALFLEDRPPAYEEISRRFGIPVSSIGPTRERCLKRLQKILKGKNK